jgi:mRNA interferase MazF
MLPLVIKDRALITVIPHTTSLRGSSFEIAVPVPFLKPGAFLVQAVTTVPTVDARHRPGVLSPDAFATVFNGLLGWLGAITGTAPTAKKL